MSTRRRLNNPMNLSTVFSNHHFFKGPGGRQFGTVFEGKRHQLLSTALCLMDFFLVFCRHVHSSQLWLKKHAWKICDERQVMLLWVVGNGLPSLKLTWHPKMMVSSGNLLFQGVMFRCYVSFREATWFSFEKIELHQLDKQFGRPERQGVMRCMSRRTDVGRCGPGERHDWSRKNPQNQWKSDEINGNHMQNAQI